MSSEATHDDGEAAMDGTRSMQLSPAGELRRADLRSLLMRDMRRRRRRSLAMQGLLVAAAVALLVLRPQRDAPPGSTAPVQPLADPVRLTIDRGDPDVVQRLRIEVAESRIRVLHDDELLATLQRSGRRGGVIRTGARLEVVGLVPDDWH